MVFICERYMHLSFTRLYSATLDIDPVLHGECIVQLENAVDARVSFEALHIESQADINVAL